METLGVAIPARFLTYSENDREGMRNLSAWKIVVFLLWLMLTIFVIYRTPTKIEAKERLEVMIQDLGDLANNFTVLSRYENAKPGSALVIYSLDASSFDGEKFIAIRNSLKGRGWEFSGESDDLYVMCKNGMKASISKKPVKKMLDRLERRIFSVSMEFNSGTEDHCRQRAH